MKYNLILICMLLLVASNCAQESKMVSYFKDTEAYELAKTVEKGDLKAIERIVSENSALLNVTNMVTGSNILVLSMEIERYDAFKKLLELGANPNFTNPYTKHSILIDAIRPFGTQLEWKKANNYVFELLKYGANPNYVVDGDFTNEKGHHVSATSPLIRASKLDLEIVKMLIQEGANPLKKVGEKQMTGFSAAAQRGKVDIVNYYIDSLKVDVHQPMSIVLRRPSNTEVTYFIQDYLVNKYIHAKIRGDSAKIDELKEDNENIEEANKDLWSLIKKLEKMGVDFENYDYVK